MESIISVLIFNIMFLLYSRYLNKTQTVKEYESDLVRATVIYPIVTFIISLFIQ